jgi:hemolysin activation/secretion protein
LAALNKSGARSVTPLLRPGRVPGTIDVDLRVEDALPLRGSLEVNNDHSSVTTPLRLNASLSYANLWQLNHVVSFGYLVAPRDRKQTEIFTGSYLAPLPGSNWSVLALGYSSNNNVTALGSSVLGKGYSIGARAIYQFEPFGDSVHSLSFGADYKNFDETAGGVTTPIDYPAFIGAYNVQSATEDLTWGLGLTGTFGLRGLATPDTAFLDKRASSRSNFVHLRLDATTSWTFAPDWTLFGRLSGQITDAPLVSNEQFSAGGLATVRGYFQGEIAADTGFNGGIEVRAPSIGQDFIPYLDEFRLFLFADGGLARTLNPLPSQLRHFALSSVGGGARFRLLGVLSGDVLVGVPLISAQTTPGAAAGPDAAPRTRAGNPKATFTVKADF